MLMTPLILTLPFVICLVGFVCFTVDLEFLELLAIDFFKSMAYRINYFLGCLILFLSFFIKGCQSNSTSTASDDSPKFGTIYISVDETFKPVIQEQLKLYKNTYPETNIVVSYKSEVDCFKDLLKDSTRLIITSRSLTENEKTYFKNKISFTPAYAVMAYDAVAAIVNINNKDSLFTLSDLKDMLSGKKNYTVILDGSNATSTVKYLQDSVLRGLPFGKNVVSANGSDSVIQLIKKTTNAIGFVSNCWVSNPYEPNQLKNLKQLKLALVECPKCEEKGMFARASQATLQYAQYPLARPLYCIVKENWTGLGTGFYNFLSLERGQLIFKRANMVPNKMFFNKRITQIKSVGVKSENACKKLSQTFV